MAHLFVSVNAVKIQKKKKGFFPSRLIYLMLVVLPGVPCIIDKCYSVCFEVNVE